MKSVLLGATNRLLMGVLLVFSVFLTVRGHNLPGGGFSGGLVAGSAFALHTLAFGAGSARRLLLVDPRTLLAVGLAIAVLSGLLGSAWSLPFLTGLWDEMPLPVIGKPGTPLLFDVGVYIVVTGMTCLIVFALAEED